MPFVPRNAPVAATNLTVNVCPTLFIGLGGSGKEVLLRLKRLFYTSLRRTGLPICEYLWMDTDSKTQNIEGQEYDKITKRLELTPDELLPVSVSSSELNQYYNMPNMYAHIFEWLSPELRRLGPQALDHGAGQFRPCGRLAFWHHYKDIRTRIEAKLQTIQQPEQSTQTTELGYAVNIGAPNVFLIASVAGGTGAGMLIDTAFLLKDINEDLTTTAILFLPSVFLSEDHFTNNPTEREQLKANGYATLMELDYYMSQKVGLGLAPDARQTFAFRWDGIIEKNLPAGPLETIYLLGRQNRSRQFVQSYTSLFQMAAEAIHLEFCPSLLGDVKRSIRSNHETFYNNETVARDYDGADQIFTEYYPNRYASFGLSKIKLDRERRRNAAGYFLARSLAWFWRKSPRGGELTPRHLADALRRPTDGNPWTGERIIKALLQSGDGVASMVTQAQTLISTDFSAISTKIEAKFGFQTAQAAADLVAGEIAALKACAIRNETVSAWTQMAEANTDGRGETLVALFKELATIWDIFIKKCRKDLDLNGDGTKQIVKNSAACLSVMKSTFLEKFFELLARPGESATREGIKRAKNFCTEYLKRLDEINITAVTSTVTQDCPLTLSQSALEPSSETAKLADYLEAARAIRAPLYRRSAVALYGKKKGDLDKGYLDKVKKYLTDEISDLQLKLNRWYKDSYKNESCVKATHLLQELRSMVENLQSGLDKYGTGLDELKKWGNEWFEAYDKNEKDYRHGTVDPRPQGRQDMSNEEWYRMLVEAAIKILRPGHAIPDWETLLDLEGVDFLKKHFNAGTREAAFNAFFDLTKEREALPQDWEKFREELDQRCFESVTNFLHGIRVDVEYQKIRAGQVNNLPQLVAMADVWIKPSPIQLTAPPAATTLIGTDLVSTATAGAAGQLPQFRNPAIVEHDDSSIVFYNEIVAFPLCHLEELWDCRDEYMRMERDRQYARLLDYRHVSRLKDVTPPRDTVATKNMFAAGVLLMEGLMFGALTAGQDRERPSSPGWLFIPQQWLDAEPVTYLGGSLSHAVGILSRDPAAQKQLRNRVQAQKQSYGKTHTDSYLRELRLVRYYLEKVFPVLERGGALIDKFSSNLRLMCMGIRRQIIGDALRQGGYSDQNDPRLKNDSELLDIEEISQILEFDEPEARPGVPLRVLKVE